MSVVCVTFKNCKGLLPLKKLAIKVVKIPKISQENAKQMIKMNYSEEFYKNPTLHMFYILLFTPVRKQYNITIVKVR